MNMNVDEIDEVEKSFPVSDDHYLATITLRIDVDGGKLTCQELKQAIEEALQRICMYNAEITGYDVRV